jgi:DNA-directed RNA polymerase subunit RPC12/RpoP
MKCPGQDMQYWTSEAIYEVKCPQCSDMVEFYKDDTSRKCGHCGHRFVNPKMDFGCASYCQFAEQCLGNLPEEFLAQRDNLLKDRVAVEVKRYFKSDFKRISRASRVARYAERIGKVETGNLAVVLCASYLLHIGYTEAVEKYGVEEAASHIEEAGVPIAKDILIKLGANEQLISSVCEIIEHHGHPAPQEDKEFEIVSDANYIAVLEDRHKDFPLGRAQLNDSIKRLRTEGGRIEVEDLAGKLGIS